MVDVHIYSLYTHIIKKQAALRRRDEMKIVFEKEYLL